MFLIEKSKMYVSIINSNANNNNIIKDLPIEKVISELNNKKVYAVSMHTDFKTYSYNQIEEIKVIEKENVKMCKLTIESPNKAIYTIDCEENAKIEFNKITDIKSNVIYNGVKFLNRFESVLYNINGELCKIIGKKFYTLDKGKFFIPKVKYNNNCFVNGILIKGIV